MFTRREDRRRLVPSPVPVRRTARQVRGAATGLCDDHYMDPRVKHRDPSPGGLGRLSTSAPSEDTFYWGPGRRYRDQRPFSADHVVDNVGYYMPGYGRAAYRDQRPFSDHVIGKWQLRHVRFRTDAGPVPAKRSCDVIVCAGCLCQR
ncbi:hypothetical protein BaRGS_00015578 [Batillaria attramentaria]|uniref:Uncharacterized protein n=1 Tax=Batillaria attramentaria TaxID=370345 RepID=A0ABD0L181_9CAEN